MKTRIIVAFAFCAVSVCSNILAEPPVQTTNAKIVEFCKANKGKQVANGECAMFAMEALKVAGCKLPRIDFKDSPQENNYVWGTLIREFKDGQEVVMKEPKVIEPGDVIQYHNARLDEVLEGGRVTHLVAHHTSVVCEVKKGGNEVVVFEQNSHGVKTVITATYDLSSLKEGALWVYHPVKKK